MDWILAALAAFNIVSMITIYRDRHAKRVTAPWGVFAYSLITTELAWLWLPTQIASALILISFGGLHSALGTLSFIALLASWIPLVKSIKQSLAAQDLTEEAITRGLGRSYQQQLSEPQRKKLENTSHHSEWRQPFKMSRPDVEVLRNIPYGPLGVRQQLDIYRPRHLPEEGCPVLLQIHGGAWMLGTKDSQALPLMHYMASKGWICVAINYRLSPSVGFPTHLEDCKRALQWIRTEGQEHGINPDFVAVTGGSAGGHLTSLMALTENQPEFQQEFPDIDTSVQAAVPFYGAYDMLARFNPESQAVFTRFLSGRVIYESPEQNPELWEKASPISQIHQESPPFMIIQGEIDSLTTVNGARHFQQQLKSTSKQPVIYLELPGAEHAFDNIHSPRTEPVIKGVHRFLEWSLAQHTAAKQEAPGKQSMEEQDTEETTSTSE